MRRKSINWLIGCVRLAGCDIKERRRTSTTISIRWRRSTLNVTDIIGQCFRDLIFFICQACLCEQCQIHLTESNYFLSLSLPFSHTYYLVHISPIVATLIKMMIEMSSRRAKGRFLHYPKLEIIKRTFSIPSILNIIKTKKKNCTKKNYERLLTWLGKDNRLFSVYIEIILIRIGIIMLIEWTKEIIGKTFLCCRWILFQQPYDWRNIWQWFTTYIWWPFHTQFVEDTIFNRFQS